MRKIVLFLLIMIEVVSAGDKYFIYFKDKGASQKTSLNKTSAAYNEALSNLSEKAIERRQKVMGDSYITFEDLAINSDYINEVKKLGVTVSRSLRWFNCISVTLNEEQLKQVKLLPFVAKVELVKTLSLNRDDNSKLDNLPKTTGVSEDINYGLSFTQLALSDIPVVHSKGITGEGVLIGFLDSGFDWKRHESLKNTKVIAEYDFIFNDSITANQEQDSPVQDDHGTKVFSTVGGYMDGSLIGAAYDAQFILSKTEYVPTETKVEEDNYAAALEWMEGKGVDITSSSLGYSEFDAGQPSYTYADMNGNTAIVTKAAELAFSRGVITITAAGNEGHLSWHYITAPADGFNTLAIGAVSSNNTLAAFSGRGPSSDGRIKPEVVAQGVSVYGAVAGTESGYSPSNGTSLATPLACGVAGLLLSAYPHLTNVQVRHILMESSDNAQNPDNDRGYGLLSAARAISFPNLEKRTGTNSYRLYKAFITDASLNPESVKLFYSHGGSSFSEGSLTFDGNYKYAFDIPVLSTNDSIKFYYTWADSSGNTFREPQSQNYNFANGSNNILLNLHGESIPEDYTLSQNYPNPFNPVTRIRYTLPEDSDVRLVIYNLHGEQITVLVDSFQKASEYTIQWNGINFPSGMYIYRLTANGKVFTQKMIMNK